MPLCWIQNVVPSPPPSFIFFLLQMDLGQEDGRRFFSLSSADRRVSSASSAPSDPVDIPGAAARRGSGNGDSGAAGGEPNTTTSLQEVCLAVHIIDIVCTFIIDFFFCGSVFRPQQRSGLAGRGRNGRGRGDHQESERAGAVAAWIAFALHFCRDMFFRFFFSRRPRGPRARPVCLSRYNPKIRSQP